MRRITVIFALAALAVAGWLAFDFILDRAPPHRFVVKLDEPAKSTRLTLGNADGNVTTEMEGGPTEFRASRDIGDSSGAILVTWPDGSTTECLIGYITNGETEPHDVVIAKRECPEIGSHVQN